MFFESTNYFFDHDINRRSDIKETSVKFPRITSRRKLRKYKGLINYYRKFITKYSTVFCRPQICLWTKIKIILSKGRH